VVVAVGDDAGRVGDDRTVVREDPSGRRRYRDPVAVDYRVGRGLANASRATGFAVAGATYLIAGGVAWAVSRALGNHHPLTVAFWADIAATLVVFLASTAVGNSSLYDPYWSVAPPVVVLAWTTTAGPRQILVDVLVLVWAIRLTANWALGWRGLGHEDWRYVQIRGQDRAPWWLVSLTGIQLMPTLTVFAGLLAVWPAFTTDSFNVIDVFAAGVTVAAIALEAIADIQLHRFTRDPANRGKTADRGLWRVSRHPNYLGEITFWWGMWLFGLAAAPSWWWTVAGPIVMVLLFGLVSVPLMDKRSLDRRPAYAEHMRRVPALLPRLTGSR
jgi:steroid 5-alpha reductase family enzyme